MPRKMRRLALKSALSARAAEGELVIIEELKLPAPKTKEAIRLLDSLDAAGNILLVASEEIPDVMLATRNIPGVLFKLADHLSVYDILAADKVVMTSQSMARIEEVLGNA
jgi:large subunit ribosomal protein L4